MKKMFRTWYDAGIEEVEVLRETAAYVTLADNQRWKKRTEDSWNYFDAWSEARQFLINREKNAIRELANKIDTHQATLQKIMEMQP